MIEIDSKRYTKELKKTKVALILVNEIKRDLICSCVFCVNHTHRDTRKDQQLRKNGTTRNTFRTVFPL